MKVCKWTETRIRRELRRLANKYVGLEFRVVRIDGEFAGILPVDPNTGEVTTAHPSELRKT